ncbi:MAG: NAD(P)H-hydrate dehydratase [Pseudomonadota bacterium]
MPKIARITPLTRKHVAKLLPPRPRDSHKGQFGTVAVIGGAAGMIGAPLIAGRAALKLGAGCVHVGLLAPQAPGVDPLQPELMLHPASAALMPSANVVAIGCGLGQSLEAQKLLHDALKLPAALVLDADALNLLAVRPDLRTMLAARGANAVLTPHPGEAARLLGCDAAQVQADRPAAAQALAEKCGCAIVLKGTDSLCVTTDGKLYRNSSGNPGMSSPGMGDALTGMIAAFLAQSLAVNEAMLLGVHLHGAAGDALAEQLASVGMTAGEVTEWARWLLNRWLEE